MCRAAPSARARASTPCALFLREPSCIDRNRIYRLVEGFGEIRHAKRRIEAAAKSKYYGHRYRVGKDRKLCGWTTVGPRGTKKALTQVNQRCAGNLGGGNSRRKLWRSASPRKKQASSSQARRERNETTGMCAGCMHGAGQALQPFTAVGVHNNFRWYPCQGDKVSGQGFPLRILQGTLRKDPWRAVG